MLAHPFIILLRPYIVVLRHASNMQFQFHYHSIFTKFTQLRAKAQKENDCEDLLIHVIIHSIQLQ